jgi:hypothetical protein
MTFEQTTGTRAQVWHGTAKKTSGGLTKSALMMNKHGRIVSRKKHNTAKKEKRLVKAGFLTKKGQFGFIKKGTRRSRSRKMRGGADDEEIMKDEIVEDGANGEIVEEDDYQFPFADSDDMDGGRRRRRRMMGGTGSATGVGFPNASPMGRALSRGGRRRRGSRSRKMRGGMAYGGPLSPLAYDGRGVGTSGVDLQFIAGNAA